MKKSWNILKGQEEVTEMSGKMKVEKVVTLLNKCHGYTFILRADYISS